MSEGENIVEFKRARRSDTGVAKVRRPDLCFQCGCGSQHFILLRDGTVVCTWCDQEQTRLLVQDCQMPGVS